MAEIMYKILKEKKEITLEDIVMQFEIAPSTAYNVQRILRSICERHPDECEVKTKNRRTVFVWIKEEIKQEDKEAEEIEKILNAQPAEK
jgi:vacuolar-type H+-ATPase subunit I/STV1